MELVAKRYPSFLKNKRFIITLILVVGVAGYFWTQSRYPQLDEKLAMGASTEVTALGFDILVDLPKDAGLLYKIYANTANWMWTNRKGMFFGLILGALMMNLIPFLKQLQSRSRVMNSGLGILMGAPLGLCVNCSTPVAHGLHESGAKPETMLATMMSSPTLNVIVLTMLFAMFPAWLAFMKIGTTLFFILAVIPLLTRFYAKDPIPGNIETEVMNSANLGPLYCGESEDDCDENEVGENWLTAGLSTLSGFGKNLWYLVKITVPLMLLAGFLGAAIVSIVPIDQAIRYLPEGRIFSWVSMLIIALFGLFLPSPMTFDIIIAAILYNAGVPIKYVAILMFTLGIFSIYPFMTIWQRMSRQIAYGLAAAVVLIGVAFGVTANRYLIWDNVRIERQLVRPFMETAAPPTLNNVDRSSQGESAEVLHTRLKDASVSMQEVWSEQEITVTEANFAPSNGVRKGRHFMQFQTQESFGVSEHANVSLYKMLIRPALSRSISAGDINRDGWTDLLLGSDSGIAVYLNESGKRFVQQRISFPKIDSEFVVSSGIVDLNNDKWPDIWVSTLDSGSFVLYSEEGNFPDGGLIQLEGSSNSITASPGFGDLDKDGRLDVVLGNVSLPGKARADRPFKTVENSWLRQNADGEFETRAMTGLSGETLSLLISDINSDGNLDVLVGNDLSPADVVYLGDGTGGLRETGKGDGVIPQTTTFTMSISSADIDNDLEPELFFGNIARRKDEDLEGATRLFSPKEMCSEIGSSKSKDECERFYTFRDSVNVAMGRNDIWQCNQFAGEEFNACIAFTKAGRAEARFADKSLCKMPRGWELVEKSCMETFAPKALVEESRLEKSIPQVRDVSVLLKKDKDLKFQDRANDFGLSKTGWTWNAKFADLDNDGWQDLYAVNGMVRRKKTELNHFYRNIEGKKFEDLTVESGLGSKLNTLGYVYIDIDNDGDLDVVTSPVIGPLGFYLNQTNNGKSVMFELDDEKGNSHGIGSKIVIRYGDGKNQMREIQASGGFQSIDAPFAHFGLGGENVINSVEVQWSTGEKTVIKRNFEAGKKYRISRSKEN